MVISEVLLLVQGEASTVKPKRLLLAALNGQWVARNG